MQIPCIARFAFLTERHSCCFGEELEFRKSLLCSPYFFPNLALIFRARKPVVTCFFTPTVLKVALVCARVRVIRHATRLPRESPRNRLFPIPCRH